MPFQDALRDDSGDFSVALMSNFIIRLPFCDWLLVVIENSDASAALL